MDFKAILIIVLGVSAAAYFTPTPNTLQTQFKNGQDLYAAKEYAKAIAQYDEIIRTDSKLLDSDSVRVSLLNNELQVGVRTAALYQKANALRNLGKKDASVEEYRAVEGRKDSPKLSALAQYQIYEMYFSGKDYQAAIAEARGLIERHPLDQKVPQAWYDIGWAFREMKQFDSSNTAYQSLTTLFPDHDLDPKARFQIAQNYFDREDCQSGMGERRTQSPSRQKVVRSHDEQRRRRIYFGADCKSAGPRGRQLPKAGAIR
jgi:tetratricopeptide (TPR) repeat protein